MVERCRKAFVARPTQRSGLCWKRATYWQGGGTTQSPGLNSSPDTARNGWNRGVQRWRGRPTTTPRRRYGVESCQCLAIGGRIKSRRRRYGSGCPRSLPRGCLRRRVRSYRQIFGQVLNQVGRALGVPASGGGATLKVVVLAGADLSQFLQVVVLAGLGQTQHAEPLETRSDSRLATCCRCVCQSRPSVAIRLEPVSCLESQCGVMVGLSNRRLPCHRCRWLCRHRLSRAVVRQGYIPFARRVRWRRIEGRTSDQGSESAETRAKAFTSWVT
jgi:hypothetical protein